MLAAASLSDHRAAFAALKAGLDERRRQTLAERLCGRDPTLFQSGIPQLDTALGGGLARGTIAAFEGPLCSGRAALAARFLAMATCGGLAALIDDGSLYPPGLRAAGVSLERLCIVSAKAPVAIARAADILLRSRTIRALAMPDTPLKAAVWSRLASLAHHAGAVLIALSLEASNELGYFSSVRLECSIKRALWSNASGIFCRLDGYDVFVRVIKNKRAAPGATALIALRNEQHAAVR